jgi:hypothetical protein
MPDDPKFTYDFPYLSNYAESSLTPAERAYRSGKKFVQENPFTTAGAIRLAGGAESALSGITSGNDYRMAAGFISMGSELAMFLLGDKLLFKLIDKARAAANIPINETPPVATQNTADSPPSSDAIINKMSTFLKQSCDIKNHPKDTVLLLGLIGSGMYASSGVNGFIDSNFDSAKLAEAVKGVLLASGFSVGRFMKSKKKDEPADPTQAMDKNALQRYYDSVRENTGKLMGDLLLGATALTLVNAGDMAMSGTEGWGHELTSGSLYLTANMVLRNFVRIKREKQPEK